MSFKVNRRQLLAGGASAALAQRASAQSAGIRERLGIGITYFHYNLTHLAMVPRVLRQILDKIAKAGIPYVEVMDYSDDIPYVPFRFSDRASMLSLHSALRDAGLKVSSFHSGLASGAGRFTDQIDAAKREIDLLMEMGGRIWLTHLTSDDGLKNPLNRQAMERLIRAYETTPVLFTVENTKGGQDVEQVLAFADAIDSPRLGITIDIGHCTHPYTKVQRDAGSHPMCDPGRPSQILRQAAKRLNHVHLHDFYHSAKSKRWEDHHVPFLGKMRWVEIMDTLEAINYRGCLLFETTELYEDTAVESVGLFPDMLDVVRSKAGKA